MKKITLLKSVLLLCALVAGSGSVWADDYYVQVTDVDDLSTDATYIIGDYASSTLRVMGALNASNRGTILTSDISISGTTITVSKDAENKPLELSLKKSGDNYMITYGATPTYLGYNSGTAFITKATAPVAGDGNKYFWTIEYNTTYNCLLITSVKDASRIILRNGTSAISTYSSSNLASYGKSTLYKKIVPLTPAKAYTTLTSADNLNFTGIDGLKAYIATSVSAGSVQMTQVNKVPAGTGLVLVKSSGSSFNVPVFDGTGADDVDANKMVGSATSTTAVAAGAGYILSEGVFQPANAGTLPKGKAYLNIAVTARSLDLDFGNGEVTSISAITGETKNVGEYYNLAGQRVAQPTKGLYIVNGKKVIMK